MLNQRKTDIFQLGENIIEITIFVHICVCVCVYVAGGYVHVLTEAWWKSDTRLYFVSNSFPLIGF